MRIFVVMAVFDMTGFNGKAEKKAMDSFSCYWVFGTAFMELSKVYVFLICWIYSTTHRALYVVK